MKIIKAQIESQNNWSKIDDQLDLHFSDKYKDYTLVSFCEMFFYKTPRVLTEKWIGVLHDPHNTDEFIPGRNIFNSKEFIDSLSACEALFCMSDALAKYVKVRSDVPTSVLYHPASGRLIREFDFSKFKLNPGIVQIGNWLRRPYAIFTLNTTINKKIIPYDARLKNEIRRFMKRDGVNLGWRGFFSMPKAGKVQVIKHVSDDVYNGLFENHIVYLNLYASTANNVILECIKGNTPILVNRLAAIEKYLGKGYPMFYNNDTDVNSLLSENNIQSTHEYLKNKNFDFLSVNQFTGEIEKHLLSEKSGGHSLVDRIR